MIRKLNIPQLSSAKPRTGMQSVGELIPRLVRMYEMKAEMLQAAQMRNNGIAGPTASPVARSKTQATFGWD